VNNDFRFQYDVITADFRADGATSGLRHFRFWYDVIVNTSRMETSFPVGIDFRFRYDVMSDDVTRAGGVVTEKFYRVVPVLHVCRSADDVDSSGNRIEECRTRF